MFKPIMSILIIGIFYPLSFSTTLKPSTNSVIIEGDIVYSKNVKDLISISKSLPSGNDAGQKRKVIRGLIHYWNNGIIPYVISSNLADPTRRSIRLAYRRLQNKTCLRFKPRTTTDKDYISFVDENGCFSSVGRQGGKQKISLGKGCSSAQKVIHEILHALGFFHEHSRYDRDKYLKVLWWNIAPGKEKNFNSYSHDHIDDLGYPYDLKSIMHYDNKAFSINGRDTLEKMGDPLFRFGRQQKMSSLDVKQIQALYKCKQPHSQGRKCFDKIQGCDNYSLQSDACESNFAFMNGFCKKSCGFCYAQ